MTRKRVSNEQMIQTVREANCIKDVLKRLGMAQSGGNYKTIKRCIERYGLDTSHFSKLGFQPGHNCATKLLDEEVFVINGNYNRFKLKTRILKDHLLPEICSRCGILEWQGEKLSLHLDHINGIRNDNRLENLRFLCPNCHSLTETYCGKANKLPPKTCINCGVELNHRNGAMRCHKCYNSYRCGKNTKIVWPTLETLVAMINVSSYEEVSKTLGVSSNAIRKHFRRQSVQPPLPAHLLVGPPGFEPGTSCLKGKPSTN